MAKEGRLGQAQPPDWPGLLRRVLPPALWRAFHGVVFRSPDPRQRWSPKYVPWCWILMSWSLQGQLTERFVEAWEILTRVFARRRRPGYTYPGLTRATGRLGPAAFWSFWRQVRSTLPQRLGTRWLWQGWPVLAVDGSRKDAPRTRRNEQALGRAGRAKTQAQWWVTWLIHRPSHILWDWRQGPGHSSERGHLHQMLADLPRDALLVADPGAPGLRRLPLVGTTDAGRLGVPHPLRIQQPPARAPSRRAGIRRSSGRATCATSICGRNASGEGPRCACG